MAAEVRVTVTRRILAVGLLLLGAGAALSAHHAWPVNTSRLVTVQGTVTSYTWGNPHVMIGLDVTDANNRVEKWNVGGPSVTRMEANGWDKATLKAGDVITAAGYQFSDGQKVLRLDKITMADGREMLLYGRR